ncbi:MAG: hypothetical protein IPL54_09685 [Chitinophagaceae bacterium]|nr:hypothetical protein [Chitinophagaceae bacterium]
MGVITCMYLLTGIGKSNWVWLIAWLGLGIIIYFLYGFIRKVNWQINLRIFLLSQTFDLY